MYYIGLDISKSTINTYIPEVDIDGIIENNLKGFKSFYSKLKKIYKKNIGDIVFIFEPTGSYSARLKRFCNEKQIKCFLVNPKQSSNFAKAIGQRNKTDISDARMLSKAHVLAKNDDVCVPKMEETVDKLKELVSYKKLLTKMRTQYKNHLEALKNKSEFNSLVKELKRNISDINKKIEKLTKNILEVIADDEKMQNDYNNILSISGVGNHTAIVLLYHFLHYSSANQKQIVSLAGLDPVESTSGTSVKRKSKISKAGSKICRSSLFMAAMSASKNNPQLISFYKRLEEKGKAKYCIYTAIMRKIIVLAYSLYKNNQRYDMAKF